jgi:hypothetical protein
MVTVGEIHPRVANPLGRSRWLRINEVSTHERQPHRYDYADGSAHSAYIDISSGDVVSKRGGYRQEMKVE